MPILSPVERKSPRGRLFLALVLLALTLGGATMVYPFLLMISGSLRSEMDENDLALVPAYLVDETALWRKFLEYRYQQDIDDYNRASLERRFAFGDIPPPPPNPALADTFRAFREETALPLHWQVLGGVSGRLTVPKNLRVLRHALAGRFDGDTDRLATEAGLIVESWRQVVIPKPDWLSPTYEQPANLLAEVYASHLREAPLAEVQLVSLTGYFLEVAVYPEFGDPATFADAAGIDPVPFDRFRLPPTMPEPDGLRRLWTDFVRMDLNPSFVLLPPEATAGYHRFLEDRYGSLADLNAAWREDHPAFAAVSLPAGEYLTGAQKEDYAAYLATRPPGDYRLIGPEYAWFAWLKDRFGTVAAANKALGLSAGAFPDIWMPVGLEARDHVEAEAPALRWQFASRNFINAIDAAILDGRAFWNTLVFCGLAVGLNLLVNPLAAYALSRFRLPGTYKVLLFLMAVMAFPPMVTTIPVFLMMKEIGLMNTFAGLVLPLAANGYFIFLLKGFFDSLPDELYEAAALDGASELRMFRAITLPLSKPVLAVVGLSAFNVAYTVFLFALIIAPAREMWLLPVWLYQYQESVSTSGVYASVLLSAIPPILVFLLAQKVILRGIVVPVEK